MSLPVHLCIRNGNGAIVSHIEFKHILKGFQRFDDERRKLGVPPSECLVAIETAYNLLVDFLLDRGYLVYLNPPQATSGHRNRSSGAHTDDSDAALFASILLTGLDSHRRLKANSALTLQILAQVRLIEVLRRSIQRQTNTEGVELQNRAQPLPTHLLMVSGDTEMPLRDLDRTLGHGY